MELNGIVMGLVYIVDYFRRSMMINGYQFHSYSG